jgi:hypothetical protein
LKLIYFGTPRDETRLGKPEPIKKFLPEWYRKAESTFVDPKTGLEEKGLKACVPFLDVMVSGYALVTPVDIYVSKKEDGSLHLAWNGPQDSASFIAERPAESGSTLPTPAGHLSNHLIWTGEWGFKLPRGWSMLVTHPVNRYDLPFITWSGLIESDKFWANGNLPFSLRADFVGTIPAGTPIAQLIPIKRSKWTAIYDQSKIEAYMLQGAAARDPKTNYKKTKWVRKEYR